MATERPHQSGRKARKKTLQYGAFGVQRSTQSPLTIMENDLRTARERFQQDVKKHYRTPPAKRESNLSTLHQAFAMQNALAVVEPLRRNVSWTNIIKAASTGIALYALSPQFREEVNRVAHNGVVGLSEALRQAQKQKDEWMLSRLKNRQMDQGHVGDSESFKERIQMMEARVRGRVPYTPEAIALAHMALDEEFYDAVRAEGVTPEDRQERLTDYQNMMSDLYRMGQEDGLSVEQMDEAYRMQVHSMLNKHPQAATLWRDTGLDGVYCSQDGFLRTETGHKMVKGAPRVRQVMSAEDHAEYASDVIYQDFMQATDAQDFSRRMMGYAVAWASTSSTVGDEVLYHAQEDPARRILRGRISLQCMADDGLTTDQQKESYAVALGHALEAIEERRPELAVQWQQALGDAWRDEVVKMIHEPDIFLQAWQRAYDVQHPESAPASAGAEQQGESSHHRVYPAVSGRASTYYPVAVREEVEVVEGELIDDELEL